MQLDLSADKEYMLVQAKHVCFPSVSASEQETQLLKSSVSHPERIPIRDKSHLGFPECARVKGLTLTFASGIYGITCFTLQTFGLITLEAICSASCYKKKKMPTY